MIADGQSIPRFAVAQIGARMHYAVPRILNEAGRLERLFTDFAVTRQYDAPPWPLRRLLSRYPRGIPAGRITHFPALAFATTLASRLLRSESAYLRLWMSAGRGFCRAVVRRGFGQAGAVYAYNSAALELFQEARARGLLCVLEQTVAAAGVLHRLLAEERAAWPGWSISPRPAAAAAEFAGREAAEWSSADVILAGSEFVVDSIRESGGPAGLCRVVPYGVDLPACQPPVKRGRRLRVLFCGAVGLRKGVPYLLEAACLLASERFEFRFVGAVSAPAAVRSSLPRHCEFVGAVPRPAMSFHYRWADVFVLPSICEGSATVCYEALAAGLPVVTTPNAGSVVRDGVDGFIVPIRDPRALAQRLELLAADAGLREHMARNAAARARVFTVAAYSGRLLDALALQPACEPVSKPARSTVPECR
ncbi:MAG TPA: glycosyltransferase family 4 protein [Bryobacteraceae bacterium]|nr:glycosyltransferase family 4 protein [Bryobacteraceae bacterium]